MAIDFNDLPLKDVALAARRLSRAGLVVRDGHALSLRSGLFGEVARAAAEAGYIENLEEVNCELEMDVPLDVMSSPTGVAIGSRIIQLTARFNF